MATVLFQTTLKRKLGVPSVLIPNLTAMTVDRLLFRCEEILGQPVRSFLLDKDGKLSRGMVFLNGRNILLQDGLQTLVNATDELNIFPPAGGG